MKKLLIFSVLLLSSFFCGAQINPTRVVWKRFYDIVELPPAAQSMAFKEINQYCAKNRILSDSTYTNLLFLYADAEFRQQHSQISISLIRQAITLAAAHPVSNPKQYLGKYHFYLGHYLQKINEIDQALAEFKLALEISKGAFDKWGIPAQSCQAIAHCYYLLQDYYSGIQYAQLGCNYARKKGDQGTLAKNLYEECISLHELDQVKAAEQLVSELKTILSSNVFPEAELGNYYKLFGDQYLYKKDFLNTRYWYLKAASAYKLALQNQELGGMYIDLHYISIAQGNVKDIKRYERLAIKYVTNPYYRCRLFNNIATDYIRIMKPQEAFKNFKYALEALPMGFKPEDSLQNPTAAQINALAEKDYPFTVLMDKVELLMDCKNFKTALKTLEILNEVSDEMRREHLGIETKLFWSAKLKVMFERAMECAYTLKDAEKAFYFLEKSRAVLLNDNLNELIASKHLPSNISLQEMALKRKLKSLQIEQPQNLSLILDAQDQLSNFIQKLEHEYPSYYERKYNNTVPELANIKGYLQKNGQSFLSFFVGEKAIYALSIGSGHQSIVKINLAAYRNHTQQFGRLSNDKAYQNQHFNPYLKSAYALYSLMIRPFEQTLTSRVIVSAEDFSIPFAALSRRGDKADYLVNAYAFSYIFSARTLLKGYSITKKNKPKGAFLGIAPVNFSTASKLASLPSSDLAIQNNGSLFKSSKLLIGKDASKQNYRKNWSEFQIVQLITHAYGDTINREPVIYFADSALKLSEIQNNPTLNTQLMLLSACKTAVGKARKGEGVYSVSRAYLTSGVPSILTTLWAIEDQDAYSLSNLVLLNIKKGLPLDLALQKAQIAWISKNENTHTLPFSWAGVILIGHCEMIKSAGDSNLKLILVSLTGILIVIALAVRKFSLRRKI
jgi:CHAT domain-containing protein